MSVSSIFHHPPQELPLHGIARRFSHAHFCYNAHVRPLGSALVRRARRHFQRRQVIVMVPHYGRKNACS